MSFVPILGGANLSLMTLKTYGYIGKVNTDITIPLIPGAIMSFSLVIFEYFKKCR